jgi:hypothetical protein
MHATAPFCCFPTATLRRFLTFPASYLVIKAINDALCNTHTLIGSKHAHRLPTTYAMLGHQVPQPPPPKPIAPQSDDGYSFDSANLFDNLDDTNEE